MVILLGTYYMTHTLLYGTPLEVVRETPDTGKTKEAIEREERDRLLEQEIQRLQTLAVPGTDTGRMMFMAIVEQGTNR